jgi:hypothetical protein
MDTPFQHRTVCAIGTCFDASTGVATPYFLAEYGANFPSLETTMRRFSAFTLDVGRKESGMYCFSVTGVPHVHESAELELLLLYDASIAAFTLFEEAHEVSLGRWRLIVATSDIVDVLVGRDGKISSFTTGLRCDYGL